MGYNILKYTYMLLISSIILACSSKETEKVEAAPVDENLVQLTPGQAKQIDLQLDRVKPRKIGGTLKLNGQIDVPPQNLISVSVPLGGYLKSSQMLPGTPVRKGQLLAVMEDSQYIQLQQDYLVAKNKLQYALKEYERQKQLSAGMAGSEKVLQQAESDYQQLSIASKALAEKLRLIGLNPVNVTENSISRTINIYSPINGYVSRVNLNIGKYVTPADVIFELVNPADIHLSLTVFEKDLAQIKIGQKVTAYSNSNPERKYETKVILVSHSLNNERSTEVHCHFEDDGHKLSPGMYMNAELQVDHQELEALPTDAIVNFENKDYVFIALGNNSFRLTNIEKGPTANGFTSVKSVLNGKDIVVKGAYSLLMKLKNTIDE
jgi:cobalt-zinc-cadmium efflux system membrane fusion protein